MALLLIIVGIIGIILIIDNLPATKEKRRLMNESMEQSRIAKDMAKGITPEDRTRIDTEANDAIVVQRQNARREDSERLRYLNQNHIAHCPKCSSPSVMPVKKGFGVGKAAVGGLLLGPIGLVGGAIGANKVEMKCMNCGHKYKN